MQGKIFLLIVLLFCGSCDEKIFTGNVDCNNCYLDKPEKGDVRVNVTITYKYPAIPVTIYYGDIDDNNVVVIDTVYSTPVYYYLPVDRRYSVKAEYNFNGIKKYVVDGTNFKTLKVTDACDAYCYVFSNDKMDARLKKEFQ
jgi:hypothetical protein